MRLVITCQVVAEFLGDDGMTPKEIETAFASFDKGSGWQVCGLKLALGQARLLWGV